MSDVWVVPGASLDNGRGFRLWYSQPGNTAPAPQPVSLACEGQPVDGVTSTITPVPTPPHCERSACVLTLALNDAARTQVAGKPVDVTIPELAPQPCTWRTLPTKIDDAGVSFLFASCFWRNDDKEGFYAAAMKELAKRTAPAFKLLIGDQVYADWPDPLRAGVSETAAARLYADVYEEYWGDAAYRDVMLTCPTFVTCDDHEFWNDYPEFQIQLPRTINEGLRAKHAKAAHGLHDFYQRSLNPQSDKTFYTITIGSENGNGVPPVSLFVADSRSQRSCADDDAPCFFDNAQWEAFDAWIHSLTGPGVLVLGQPLFQKDGDWRDHSLSNFEENYARLWGLIEAAQDGRIDGGKPHDILVLSGDIHTGRLATARGPGDTSGIGVPEFISSPASMIRVGKMAENLMQFAQAFGFGASGPSLPPEVIPLRGNGSRKWFTQLDLDQDSGEPCVTEDNNIGMVRLTPGTRIDDQARVRFELSLWRIRPKFARFAQIPTLVFKRELQLR